MFVQMVRKNTNSKSFTADAKWSLSYLTPAFSFGFKDGVSQPAITGFNTKPKPGQPICGPEVILMGHDAEGPATPAWIKDGTFMTFRLLKQMVPEFDEFLKKNGNVLAGYGDNGPEYLGSVNSLSFICNIPPDPCLQRAVLWSLEVGSVCVWSPDVI